MKQDKSTFISKILNMAQGKANSLFFRLASLSDSALKPKSLIIEIIDDCNLNCPMCPRKFAHTEGKYMSYDRFEHLINSIGNVSEITLLGRGETLMHPELNKILALGKSRNIQFTIVTNGVLLKEAKIPDLDNVKCIIASIDHPHNEGYREIRGANLEMVTNNLINLKKARKEIFLWIQALIMENNIEYLPDFITMARRVQSDRVSLIHLIAFNQSLDRQALGKFSELEARLEEAKESAGENKIELIATPGMAKSRVCIEPWLKPRISLEGDVYPCCYVYETSEPYWEEWYKGVCVKVPQSQYKMGNIFESSFEKIWNGKDYKLLRKTVRRSQRSVLLSDDVLNKRRETINIDKRFSYCLACLYRQNKAC